MPDLRVTRDEAAGLLDRLRLLATHARQVAEDRAESRAHEVEWARAGVGRAPAGQRRRGR